MGGLGAEVGDEVCELRLVLLKLFKGSLGGRKERERQNSGS